MQSKLTANVVRGMRSILSAFLFIFFITACSEESPQVNEDQISGVELAGFGNELVSIPVAGEKPGESQLKGPDQGRFEITLKFVVPVTDRQREVFEEAAARWQRIIINDVPSVTPELFPIPSAFTGFPPVADIGETVDDIIIEVALAPIDGPGGILGQAGPRFARLEDNLTLSGVMFFDVADLAFLEQLDLFEDVIVHEMGHVLGIGTLWSFQRSLLAGTAQEPFFNGKKANVHWGAEGGTGFLPVENIGGAGTRFSHWRESVLFNELMTGFLNLGENPLSRITAGSLRDLGYKSAMVGEQYDLPKGAPGVDIDALTNGEDGLNIAAMENVLEPVGYVTTEQ